LEDRSEQVGGPGQIIQRQKNRFSSTRPALTPRWIGASQIAHDIIKPSALAQIVKLLGCVHRVTSRSEFAALVCHQRTSGARNETHAPRRYDGQAMAGEYSLFGRHSSIARLNFHRAIEIGSNARRRRRQRLDAEEDRIG
jgi:hypothetical protein